MNVETVAERVHALSKGLCWCVDRICALLLVSLVLTVWLGVFARYLMPIPVTFTEELARYLMIWTALLAVSSGIAYREHIGVQALRDRLPRSVQRVLLLLLDALGFVFFALLIHFGLVMVERGGSSFTMIFGMTKALPFAAVPVAAALAALQLLLVGLRDQLRLASDMGSRPP